MFVCLFTCLFLSFDHLTPEQQARSVSLKDLSRQYLSAVIHETENLVSLQVTRLTYIGKTVQAFSPLRQASGRVASGKPFLLSLVFETLASHTGGGRLNHLAIQAVYIYTLHSHGENMSHGTADRLCNCHFPSCAYDLTLKTNIFF